METVQQNGRFTLFSSKFPSNIYSILYDYTVYRVYSPIKYRTYRVHSPMQYRTIYTIQYTGSTVLYNTGLYTLYSIQGIQSYTIQDSIHYTVYRV